MSQFWSNFDEKKNLTTVYIKLIKQHTSKKCEELGEISAHKDVSEAALLWLRVGGLATR